MNIKLSDYVAHFIRDHVAQHVFAITGGASLHLMHSIEDCEGVQLICTQHEQAASMAADGYSRATGKMGVVIATSGPGATNLLTGVCCSYYDSVPLLCLTGQVSTFRQKGTLGVRQLGFQETNTIEIFKSVTKYTALLQSPERIRYELEKALFIAQSGRPGPVLIDIPDNLQRAMINPEALEGFSDFSKSTERFVTNINRIQTALLKCKDWIQSAKRPVLILGWGVVLSKSSERVIELVESLKIPTLVSWGANFLLPESHPLKVGTFGTHGTRYGNFVVQNCDFILSIGCRLDTHEAGSPLSDFARSAKKVIVDIDSRELNKFLELGLSKDQLSLVEADAYDFIEALLSVKNQFAWLSDENRKTWLDYISECKTQFPICPERFYQEEKVNPYVFVKLLSQILSPSTILICDTGCAVAWLMQAFEFKEGQKFFHAFNNTPMGYGLPGAIGAYLADPSRLVVCVAGDGGIQMNIQEFATVARLQLPLKIFILDNKGQSMIRQTQDQWFNSNYVGSSYEGGLPLVRFAALAEAYDLRSVEISKNREISENVQSVLKTPGPVVCVVHIDSEHRVIPQCRYGRPLEDADPALSESELKTYML